MNKANPARGPPTQPAFNDLNAFNPFNDYLEKPMETLEKLELRKEITDEVREELTRSSRKYTQERILLALCILALEAFFWGMIVFVAAQDAGAGLGLFLAAMLCILRCMQMGMIKEFSDD